MNHFRNRLTVIMMLMVTLSVCAAAVIMVKTFKDNHMNALEDYMTRELRIISAKTDWKFLPISGDNNLTEVLRHFDKEAQELSDYTDARVTFIRDDGVVIGDSMMPASDMDNHLSREEIMEASRSGIGRAIRASETLHQNLLYVAVPAWQEDQAAGRGNAPIVRLAISLQEVEQSINQLTMMLALGLLVLLVAATIISYRLASGLTKPLMQITKVAKKIQNLDYEARVKVMKQDEIGELGHAINAMADSLHVQLTQIRRNENQLESVLNNMINGIVMIDNQGHIVLLNRRAEEVLGFSASDLVGRHYAEAKQQYELSQMISEGLKHKEHLREEITFYFPEERLLELNIVPIFPEAQVFAGVLLVLQDVTAIRRLERMRSEFVANVSHELKTPIAAVKGFAETLLGGAVKDEETTNSFLQIIFDESDRLNRLIGDILELSKVESRRVPLSFSPIELHSFMERTLKLVEKEAARKNIHLDTEIERGLYVEADEDRLRQIVMNLLSNGINYTPEGGSVHVKVEGNGEDFIRISISDSGIGIPKKDLPRIFERFYRVDKARSRGSGGTGLGLSIVKHLVELHKGTIAVTSTVGVGSTFTIELPVIQ